MARAPLAGVGAFGVGVASFEAWKRRTVEEANQAAGELLRQGYVELGGPSASTKADAFVDFLPKLVGTWTQGDDACSTTATHRERLPSPTPPLPSPPPPALPSFKLHDRETWPVIPNGRAYAFTRTKW